MEPLRITASMLTGQIATHDRYLPLDSMLAWAWMCENRPEKMEVSLSGIRADNLIHPELPLERRGSGEDWYWACSFACGEVRREEIQYWHKRFDQAQAEEYVDFQGRRGAVNVKGGRYKNYRMPFVIILAKRLTWYAVGDRVGVDKLLRRVTHVGKNRSQGFGRVSDWKVESWPEDLSWLRHIPLSNGVLMMGIRPPYWLNEHLRPCSVCLDPRLLYNGAIEFGGDRE